MELGCFTFDDLREFTNDFSDENLVGGFQFGAVYHGKIPIPDSTVTKQVTIKIWEPPRQYSYCLGDCNKRLMDEVIFLQQNQFAHPMLMNMYGFCCDSEEQCGIVYDFQSFDTVSNLIDDDDFTWCQRMKVALKFAHFLRFVHRQNAIQGKKPLLVRNIDASHIMVDKDMNPKLYDFSMITGGMFPDRTSKLPKNFTRGSYGYIEPYSYGWWSEKSDVYAFGVVLLGLMIKAVQTKDDVLNSIPCVAERCITKYEEGETSVVHKSFEADESFYSPDGPKITQLAIRMVNHFPDERPDMEDVVNQLESLEVVRRHLNVYIEKGNKMFSVSNPSLKSHSDVNVEKGNKMFSDSG